MRGTSGDTSSSFWMGLTLRPMTLTKTPTSIGQSPDTNAPCTYPELGGKKEKSRIKSGRTIPGSKSLQVGEDEHNIVVVYLKEKRGKSRNFWKELSGTFV